MLGVAIRELGFFPRCREAALLRLLFRYCVALFQWEIITPRRRMFPSRSACSWEDWLVELRAVHVLPPVGRLLQHAVGVLSCGSRVGAWLGCVIGDSPGLNRGKGWR